MEMNNLIIFKKIPFINYLIPPINKLSKKPDIAPKNKRNITTLNILIPI